MNDQGPLYIKYRPKTFEEFVGNEATITSLKSILTREQGTVKTFLLYGASGCGKTTLARIISSELDCSSHDFYEYNVANTRGIDSIREIIQSARYAPLGGKIKIYLLDEIKEFIHFAHYILRQQARLKYLHDIEKAYTNNPISCPSTHANLSIALASLKSIFDIFQLHLVYNHLRQV